MEPNTQKVDVMRQRGRELQTDTATSKVVHDVSAGADSDHIVHISSSEGVDTNPTQIRSSNGQIEALEEVDPSLVPRKLLTKKQYGLHLSVTSTLAMITIQSGSSDKESSAVLAVILLMNFALASWAMSQTYCIHQLTWKVIIYRIAYSFTWLLAVYVALSTLQPDWFRWWGFVIVCIIATAYSSYKCSDELKTKFTRCCEKVVLVMNYVIDKVLKHTRTDQASPASAPTGASV